MYRSVRLRIGVIRVNVVKVNSTSVMVGKNLDKNNLGSAVSQLLNKFSNNFLIDSYAQERLYPGCPLVGPTFSKRARSNAKVKLPNDK